jgi:hypothetical protein
MKRLFTLILFVSLSSFSQKKEERVVLGFYCGYSGSGTEVVGKFGELLYNKNYKDIRNLLFSKIPADNFLAIVICKRLAYKNLIKLTEVESKRIAELYKSKEKIPVCGGCTYSGEEELGKMLNSKPEMFAAIDYYFHDEE